jgi:hypothetical protein
MSSQAHQQQESEPDPIYTRREGRNESVCMRCFETLRAPTEKVLGMMERTHLLDCPRRPLAAE